MTSRGSHTASNRNTEQMGFAGRAGRLRRIGRRILAVEA